MDTSLREQESGSPERLIGPLIARLRSHALWDALAVFTPPLLAFVYMVVYFYRAAWIAPSTFLVLSVTCFGVALVAVILRYRPRIPAAPAVARLMDDKAAAQDRFLTLATIETSRYPPTIVARLRREAAGLAHRVDVSKDFPYRVKRSFYRSAIGALIALALFHLLFVLGDLYVAQLPPRARLDRLADKMARTARFSELGRALEALAAKLDDPDAPAAEKQALVQELLKKIENQRSKEEEQSGGANLLGQAADALKGLEQGPEKSQEKDPEKGGGGVKSNLPQEGQSDGKTRKGGGGDGEGEMNAQLTKGIQDGKSAQEEPRDPGKEKSKGSQGDGKGGEPDRNKGKEMTGKAQGGSEEKIGRSKTEEIPSGAPPAERFLQPGQQGKEGLEGARYVTVQLPEAAAESGDGGGAGQTTKARAKVPVSNVPLPAHVPGAAAEKQPLPLEYRGLIR